MKLLFALTSCLVTASFCEAVIIAENFSADPIQNGWKVFGDTNLFQWDSTNQNLAVTWDSSKTNSFFYHPLETVVARSDDFSLSFDLLLNDIAAGTVVNPDKTNTFELAVGFINLASATRTNLQRGIVGANGARSVCEFDYFPDTGHGDTVSPTMIATNNQFATKFAFPLTLDPGALFHISMNFTAADKTLRTSMTRNGDAFGPIPDVILGSTFKDFRLDQIAVCSYSDSGTTDSLLAHGVVDNFIVTVPPPPVVNLIGTITNNVWSVEFTSRSNWIYTLEQTADFVSWNDVSIPVNGNATNLFLSDTNLISDKSFYRVRADRP